MKMALIPIMASCAVALATTVWADGNSTGGVFTLIHQSENQNLCVNIPYQNFSNFTQLVVNLHCDYTDAASQMKVLNSQSYQQVLLVNGDPDRVDWRPDSKCMDNSYQRQEALNPIVVYDCNGSPAQEWDWDGAVFHLHVNPAWCLTVQWGDPASEGHLVLDHCNGQGNQRFVATTSYVYDQTLRHQICPVQNLFCGPVGSQTGGGEVNPRLFGKRR